MYTTYDTKVLYELIAGERVITTLEDWISELSYLHIDKMLVCDFMKDLKERGVKCKYQEVWYVIDRSTQVRHFFPDCPSRKEVKAKGLSLSVGGLYKAYFIRPRVRVLAQLGE